MWGQLALLLLAGVVVNGQVTVTGGPTTGGPSQGCTASTSAVWNITLNSNVAGGTSTNDSSLPLCQDTCVANPSCTGIDYDNLNVPHCWLTLIANPTIRTGQAPGVDHYALFARPVAGSNNCQTQCTITYTPLDNSNVLGGTATNDGSLAGCQSSCSNNVSCIGLDYDPAAPSKCYLTFSGLPRTGLAPGVTHYTISRSPAGCVPTAGIGIGCIWLSENGLAAKVDPASNNLISYTDDINDATVFQTTNCLGKNVPEAQFNDTCVSFIAPDFPGLYVREQYGSLYLQQRYDDNYANRFAEDASFYSTSTASGAYLIQPTATDGYYLSVDDDGNLGVSQTATNLYCTAAPPSYPVAGSCPYTWSRINSLYLNTPEVPIPHGLDDCRQACLTTPNCIAVSSHKHAALCRFRLTTSSGLYRFVPSDDYDFYELWRPFPNPCQRGCVSTWTPSTSSFTVIDTKVMESEYRCRRRCLKIDNCTAVNFNTATNLCTRLSALAGNSPAKWQRNPIYTDCGDCVTSIAEVVGFYDAAAVAQLPVADWSQCLTICVNNPKCVGYELRAGVCYASLGSLGVNMTLVANATARHVDIFRSACGAGCVHKWDFYLSSRMSSSGAVSVDAGAKNGQECRENCARRPGSACNMVDWDPTTSNCTYGVNVAVEYGTAFPVNNFVLSRDADCK